MPRLCQVNHHCNAKQRQEQRHNHALLGDATLSIADMLMIVPLTEADVTPELSGRRLGEGRTMVLGLTGEGQRNRERPA